MCEEIPKTKPVNIYDMDADVWKRWKAFCVHKDLKIADALTDTLTQVMDQEGYQK